jgi:hypothetical protein
VAKLERRRFFGVRGCVLAGGVPVRIDDKGREIGMQAVVDKVAARSSRRNAKPTR